MKRSSYLILFTLVITVSCHAPRNIKSYYVKIDPIGNSDIFRYTLFIGMTNDHFPSKKITIDQLITDSVTLNHIITFVKDNDYHKNSSKTDFHSYGCFEISLFNDHALITRYKLDKSDSHKYLNSLINKLTEDNLDPSLIKTIREDALRPID